jgi:hypothetical protein
MSKNALQVLRRRLAVFGVFAGFAVLASMLISASATDAAAQAVRCGGRTATIVGTSGPDRLVGTSGPDVIVGLGGADVIIGRGGNDRICAGRGADTIRAGGGRDRVWGGRGDDRILGQGGRDVLRGGSGQDFVFGGGSGDRLAGGRGLDSLHGQAGTDAGSGGRGSDFCSVEQRSSCEVGYRSGADTARAFIEAAVAGRPLVQFFAGMEAYFRAGSAVPLLRPGRDPRPGARRAVNHFDRFDSGEYVIGLSTRNCSESNGGDLSYTCSFRVIQDGVGLSDVTMGMSFNGQIYSWTATNVVRACSRGGRGEQAIVLAGAPASCRTALRVTDRYFNDDSLDRQGSSGAATVDGWRCGSNSGFTYSRSGVGGSCSTGPPLTQAIFCDADFEPQPNIRPWEYDSRATECSLVL